MFHTESNIQSKLFMQNLYEYEQNLGIKKFKDLLHRFYIIYILCATLIKILRLWTLYKKRVIKLYQIGLSLKKSATVMRKLFILWMN